MSPEFIFLLNVVLVSRLAYVFREERLTTAGVSALLVTNEVNLLLRIQLRRLRLGPDNGSADGTAGASARSPEYMHGKVIGILERILIYAAVMSNQVAAVGLVLAAKGFVRFKEMDDRRFAEYVLIGTLLSALLAVAVALFVKALL